MIVKATLPQNQTLLLVCPDLAIAISPVELAAFHASLGALWKSSTGIDSEKPVALSDMGFWNWGVWRDRVSKICLAISFLLLGLQFIFVSQSLNKLLGHMPLHIDEMGQPTQLGCPSGFHVLPLLELPQGSLLL